MGEGRDLPRQRSLVRKAKCGATEVSDVRWLRQLQDENGKLNWPLADTTLHNAVLDDLLRKG